MKQRSLKTNVSTNSINGLPSRVSTIGCSMSMIIPIMTITTLIPSFAFPCTSRLISGWMGIRPMPSMFRRAVSWGDHF